MGLGKSVQALVAIAVMQIETATTMQQQQQPHQRPRSLIVCPAVLIRHWQREIGKFFPEKMMRPLLYEDINTGTGKGTRVRASSNNANNANNNNNSLGNTTTSNHHDDDGYCIYGGDVVIVSYEALRRDKGGFFTRDCHSNGGIDGGISTAPSSWLAVVLDEVGMQGGTYSIIHIYVYIHID